MIPLPIWVYPTAGAALLAIGAAGGWTVQGWRCEAAQAEALKQAAKQMEKAADKMQSAASDYEDTRSHDRTESRDAQTEIPTIYRDRAVSPDCALDPTARSVLQRRLDSANAATGR